MPFADNKNAKAKKMPKERLEIFDLRCGKLLSQISLLNGKNEEKWKATLAVLSPNGKYDPNCPLKKLLLEAILRLWPEDLNKSGYVKTLGASEYMLSTVLHDAADSLSPSLVDKAINYFVSPKASALETFADFIEQAANRPPFTDRKNIRTLKDESTEVMPQSYDTGFGTDADIRTHLGIMNSPDSIRDAREIVTEFQKKLEQKNHPHTATYRKARGR
jgi:hypothetical protein